ncbi:hypothetical protein ACFP3H_06950 [Nocardia lasii]|uniref:Uncharacterized protein n=1 Tax=Nocardia lasii TaxID=1616107 RepID=A0ABW1JPE8_9NOCA
MAAASTAVVVAEVVVVGELPASVDVLWIAAGGVVGVGPHEVEQIAAAIATDPTINARMFPLVMNERVRIDRDDTHRDLIPTLLRRPR